MREIKDDSETISTSVKRWGRLNFRLQYRNGNINRAGRVGDKMSSSLSRVKPNLYTATLTTS